MNMPEREGGREGGERKSMKERGRGRCGGDLASFDKHVKKTNLHTTPRRKGERERERERKRE